MTRGQNVPPKQEKGPGNTAKSKEAATRAANLKKLPKTRPLEGPPHAVKSTTASMTEDSNDVEEVDALDTEEGEVELYHVAYDVNTDDESAQAGPSKKEKTNDSNTRVTETHSSAMSTTDARASVHTPRRSLFRRRKTRHRIKKIMNSLYIGRITQSLRGPGNQSPTYEQTRYFTNTANNTN